MMKYLREQLRELPIWFLFSEVYVKVSLVPDFGSWVRLNSRNVEKETVHLQANRNGK